MVVIMETCVQISTDNGNNHVQKSELRYVVYIWECVNSGMDYWNGGILEWDFLKFNISFYIQISTTPHLK